MSDAELELVQQLCGELFVGSICTFVLCPTVASVEGLACPNSFIFLIVLYKVGWELLDGNVTPCCTLGSGV